MWRKLFEKFTGTGARPVRLRTALLVLLAGNVSAQTALTIAYPNGAISWPLFIAKEGGYYAANGLNVTLTFAPHPSGVAMLVSGEAQALQYSLEQILQAATKSREIVIIASPLNRGMFALLAWKDIRSIADLRGRRIGVGQLGDANYGYSLALLAKEGLNARSVDWVPLGPNVNTRTAALLSHRVDAALLTAPAYFELIGEQIKVLANFADRRDILASSALAMSARSVGDKRLATSILKAHVEAVKKFYDDREFATQAYMHYDRSVDRSTVDKLYKLYAGAQVFERVPYVLANAVEETIKRQTDAETTKQMKATNFRNVIDNTIVDQLVADKYFERLFGVAVLKEQAVRKIEAFPKP